MTLDTYGHVFDELDGAEPVTAEAMIRKARATQVRPRRRGVGLSGNENPA